jgi:hypothetical protein
MRVGDGQLRLVGNGLQRVYSLYAPALFLHACGCHLAFRYRPCRAGAQFFIAFAQNAFFVALAVWRDAVDLLRLAVDVFLLGVLAVVLLLELAAFFLRSAVVPLAGCAFGVAEACVCPEACASGVSEIDVKSNAQSEIAILLRRATEQSPD